MVFGVVYGYSNNTPSDGDASWCVDSEQTCTAHTADYHNYSSYREIPNVFVPAGSTTCPDGMTQEYNYVYLKYSCIPGKYSIIICEFQLKNDGKGVYSPLARFNNWDPFNKYRLP